MKRGYSKEWFLDRALKLKELVPDVSISTDIIVGFPYEDERDFEDTIDIVKRVKFNQIFSFIYSKRPHTEAESFKSQIDKDIANQRLKLLQELHYSELDKINQEKIGKVYSILFEQELEDGYLTGRADNNYLVKVKAKKSLINQIADVKIKASHRMRLDGELI
jgi:tRNA-2-methylthio-N6-dimethylallyladenosine synthase